MILELEDVFDIQLEADEIERMTSVQSILDVLNAKLRG
jgi:acyl carrier protein